MNHARLYYHDAYTTRFTARVLEQTAVASQPAVTLDRTYFYPTSGGQPFDTGTLNGVPVLNVETDADNERILHMLAAPLEAETVHGEVNWRRRFDHMQQHTGQHILSQAFIRIAQAETVGFHLSDATVTIDLDRADLDENAVAQAEQMANGIIWENRLVHIRFTSPEQASALALRKIPPARDGQLRLVHIEGFDLTACGGTHVARTGEVGLLKVTKLERRGEKLRVEFRCGQRALDDYRERQAITAVLMAQLTTGLGELETAVAKLQDENKAAARELGRLRTAYHQLEAQQILRQSESIGSLRLIRHAFDDRSPGDVRSLCVQLTEEPGVVALLALADDQRAHLVFGRAADAPGSMRDLLQTALSRLGSRSGGGSNTLAQGAASPASATDLQELLEQIGEIWLEQIAMLG